MSPPPLKRERRVGQHAGGAEQQALNWCLHLGHTVLQPNIAAGHAPGLISLATAAKKN